MPRPLKSSDARNQRIVGVFRARLQGDPEDYAGEDGDYFRVFIGLENGSFFEVFDDLHKDDAAMLYDGFEVVALHLKPVEQIMAQDCIGKTIQDVSSSARNVTIVWLMSGQMITVESDYDTVVCLQDVEEYRRDCPSFFEDVRPLDES